jgi:hypothetical protein
MDDAHIITHSPRTGKEPAVCSGCQGLTFKSLSGLGTTRSDVRFTGSPRTLAASTCQLCRLIGAVTLADIQNNGYPQDYYDQSVLILDGSIRQWKWKDELDHSKCYVDIFASGDFNFHIDILEVCNEESFKSRHEALLKEYTADLDFVRNCFRECSIHDEACGRVPESTAFDLRVIDCRTKLVVSAPSKCLYAALSYVWSHVSDASVNISHSDDLQTTSMPKLIEDSLFVAQKLGYNYIWIDRYCIDQSDIEGKALQIQQMDKIYQEAQVTIIAATDLHANGLPGILGTPRERLFADLGNFGLVPVARDIHYIGRAIDVSDWNMRGWTYQEKLFSKRRVYFTQWHIAYQCCGTHWIHKPPRKMPRGRAGRTVTEFVLNNESVFDQRLASQVSIFSKRKLTFADDVLNAMDGIFNSHRTSSRTQTCTGVILAGHPWDNLSATKILIQGLSWYHDYSLGGRRPAFPSWSWAGWMEAQVSSTFIIDSGWFKSDTIAWVEKRDGTIIEPIELWDVQNFQDRASYRYLHLDVLMLNLGLPTEMYTTGPGHTHVSFAKAADTPEFKTEPGQGRSYMRLDIKDDQLLHESRGNPLFAALLGYKSFRATEKESLIMVVSLILTEKGDHYERVAIDELDTNLKEWERVKKLALPYRRIRIG